MNFSPHGLGNPAILEHLFTSMTPNMKCQKTPGPLDHITISWLHDIFNLRESFTVLHTVPVSLKSGFFVAVFNPIIEPYFKYDYIFSWYLDIGLPYWDQWMLSDSGKIFCVSVSLRKILLFITVLWPMTDASY